MTELIRNAWTGWKDYGSGGKQAALLLAVLFFLWFGKKKVEKQAFLLYTTVMTICCILPFTAAFLMAYQTRFYDYVWIWSMAPVTAAVSWGMVSFFTDIWPDFKPERWRRGAAAAAALLGILLLCGGPGGMLREQETQKADRRQAEKVLAMVRDTCPEQDICLWAPRGIMEYAREADAAVRLPYGRDMWDASLGAYSYDTYEKEKEELYRWMEEILSFPGDGEVSGGSAAEPKEGKDENGTAENGGFTAKVCAAYVRDAGVDCILLPDICSRETIEAMEKALHADAHRLEDYWIFYGWTD